MPWVHAFRHFNPFKDPLDIQHGYVFIVERAKRYIKDHPHEELQYGLELLHTLVIEHEMSAFAAAIIKENETGITQTHLSRANNLREAMKDFDIGDIEDYPNASWPELFALFALLQVSEIISTTKDLHAEKDGFPVDIAYGPLFLDMALDAMDALGEAEALTREEQIRETELPEAKREARRAQAAKAATQRAEPYHKVRLRCIELFKEKYSSRSNRDAGRRIFENDLTAEEKAVFRTDDPPHRIEVWIGSYRKETL